MKFNFEECVKLLYKHVDVSTDIKQARDFESSFVTNRTSDNKSSEILLTFSGILKVIDPITGSTILCCIEEDRVTDNILILGHCITDIKLSPLEPYQKTCQSICDIIESDTQAKLKHHPYFNRPETYSSLTPKQTVERRDSIQAWLSKNRITASINEETNEIVVAERARIRPPYEHESDFVCPTRIVYKRLKRIISMMECP